MCKRWSLATWAKTAAPAWPSHVILRRARRNSMASICSTRRAKTGSPAHAPNPISELKKELPKVYQEFATITGLLEKHYHDMQDCEFTIERGKLWMLQTRTGKRSGAAAVRVAVEMVSEKLIDRATAIQRVTPEQLDQLLHPTVDPKPKTTGAAPGV